MRRTFSEIKEQSESTAETFVLAFKECVEKMEVAHAFSTKRLIDRVPLTLWQKRELVHLAKSAIAIYEKSGRMDDADEYREVLRHLIHPPGQSEG